MSKPKKFIIKLDADHADLLVSILDESYERYGGNVFESGYGFTTNTGEFVTADGGSVEELLEEHFKMIIDKHHNHNK